MLSLVKDFCPISLTTLTYKVVAKQVMNAIISPFQSVFIEGRQILDLVLIADGAVEDYRAKRKRAGL